MVLTLTIVLGASAGASEPLQEIEGLPFTLAVHPWLKPRLATMSDQAAFSLARVLPSTTVEMDILALSWPKSELACWLAVANSMPRGAAAGSPMLEHLAYKIGDGEPGNATLRGQRAGARLNRVVIWPTAKSVDADLVCVCSLATDDEDAQVVGFVIGSDGGVSELDTGGALTLYGWFDARDLDNDGLYELITSRNLDGTWGGFFYHAVRAFEPGTRAYVAKPDPFYDYFAQEKAWLDWVVEMREIIQAQPAEHLNQSGIGYAYVAEYEGRNYGFDSIIEVPLTFTGVGDVEEFNRGRREAFELIAGYRDELGVWLEGGPSPPTWKLAR